MNSFDPVEGFFDNIEHESILAATRYNSLIEGWLKAGFVEPTPLVPLLGGGRGGYNPTEIGTPQGGVISPLLANIGLHGLETYIRKLNPKVGVVRYADDFIVTGKDRESLELLKVQINQWLSERGLRISEEKTRIVHIKEGFNFLGFNLRQYEIREKGVLKTKLLIKPQQSKILEFCKKLGKTMDSIKTGTPEQIIRKIEPQLRGFANYYRSAVSSKTFSYISSRVWWYLWKWAKRRHPKKGKKWIKKKYFRSVGKRKWVFFYESTDRGGRRITHDLYDIDKVLIIRHIKVAGTNSPDDPELKEYWLKRKTKTGRQRWADKSKYFNVAEAQGWKCPICHDHLFNGEQIETHHIVPIKNGGSDDVDNKPAPS